MNARSLVAFLLTGGLACAIPTSARADDCSEIMNMVKLDVAPSIVVATISRKVKLEPSTVRCLEENGAPAPVIEAAKRKAGTDDAVAEAANRSQANDGRNGGSNELKNVEALGGELDLKDDINEMVDEPTTTTEGGLPGELQAAIDARRAGKSQTASLQVHQMLAQGKYPRHNTRMLYTMGVALYDLGLYHSAQHYFLEVVRKGPNNPFFQYAMPKLTGIARVTGNDYELLRIVTKIPPDSFPRQVRNELYYLLGRRAYTKDDFSEAMSHFQTVQANSELYPRAKYFEGVIAQQQGRLKTAVMAFREVIVSQPQVSGSQRLGKEIENLKDLSTLNIARIYYGLERYDNADVYYSTVDRDSDYWPRSLFERGWTNFLQGDLNKSLGLLLTVDAPYFDKSKFIPDLTILRALTFFNLCDFSQTENMLKDFEDTYRPISAELDETLGKYGNREARKLWDQAFDRYFADETPETTLDEAMLRQVLRNRDLAAIVDHLALMDREVQEIELKPTQWRESVGRTLLEEMQKDRLTYKRRAGREMLRELQKQNDNLKDLLFQSEIIRFEVADAQAEDYAYRAKNLDDLESGRRQPPNYATNPEFIYWPFNGEFWLDELGYYRYAEENRCR